MLTSPLSNHLTSWRQATWMFHLWSSWTSNVAAPVKLRVRVFNVQTLKLCFLCKTRDFLGKDQGFRWMTKLGASYKHCCHTGKADSCLVTLHVIAQQDRTATLCNIAQRRQDFSHPTFGAFVDLRAAFDSLIQPALWLLLTRLGIPDKIVRLFTVLYDNSVSCVQTIGTHSSWFKIEAGVCQGCVLAPDSFATLQCCHRQ